MKKFFKLIALIIILNSFTACSVKNENDVFLENWYQEANLEGSETTEQLYEAALGEDTLIIYSTTTRIYDVKDSFEKAYPNLTAEVYDIRASDLTQALESSYQSGEWLCDIVICSDDTAELSNVFLKDKVINKYVPPQVEPLLYPEANSDLLYFVFEMEQLFYNPTTYAECPIDNWWELTEEEWYGNVYMNSPLRSHPAYALLHSVIANSDEMADAYFEHYGEELIVPEGSSAGEIFWERLVANGLKLTTSSNELIELIGAPNQENPPMVFMISSKIRRSEIGLDAAPAYGVSPSDGVYSTNSVSIAGGAKNINSAKLFIHYLLTEEGLAPYMLDGVWSVRTDLESLAQVKLEEGNFWYNDKSEVWAQREYIEEFWKSLLVE